MIERVISGLAPQLKDRHNEAVGRYRALAEVIDEEMTRLSVKKVAEASMLSSRGGDPITCERAKLDTVASLDCRLALWGRLRDLVVCLFAE